MKYEVLRKILAPVRKEMIGGWRNLHEVELHDSYTSPDITEVVKSKTVRLVGHVTGIGGRKVHTVLGASRNETAWNTWAPRWENNIKTNLKKKNKGRLAWTGFNWLGFVTRGNTVREG
jgi:hypothetical protein